MRGVRDDFILGRYEPWMVNTSLQGGIHSVPKMKASKGAFSIRSGLLLLGFGSTGGEYEGKRMSDKKIY